jgi:spore coat polysaccharide biosynthesis predicted glycosyltransferase SpsG
VRVCVRADVSTSLGLGHLRRCLSLALALRRCGADVQFVARHSDVDARTLVEAAGLSLAFLPADIDVDDDAKATAALAKASGAHWVVVDHYGLDALWHEEVRARTNARIAVIDDLADRPLSADALIDHNLVVAQGGHRTRYAQHLLAVRTAICAARPSLHGFTALQSAQYGWQHRHLPRRY